MDEYLRFQFTHPGRGATVHGDASCGEGRFQFTHPGRGATEERTRARSEVGVSIHAPREGCDSRF